MRVCYFGTYRQEYSRNQIMIEGLRQAGMDVVECHETLWSGIEDRVQAASGGWLRPAFIWRVVCTYWHLLQHYRRVGDYDIMVVGYPGQFDVFLARLLTWLRRKPLVWDIFMSIYLIALERRLDQHSRSTIGALRGVEWLACRLPDRLILDTAEYVAWFGRTYDVAAERFRLVPTGADDRVYRPVEVTRSGDDPFRVMYFGTYIPNHGVQNIIEAARLLRGKPQLEFELVGDGPERETAQKLAASYGLVNISFVAWLDQPALVARAAHADLILGAFGSTPQSVMTVQNKIYAALAMAKPVVTGDSPAVRQALIHGEHVYLCERENPRSLAEAICNLQNDATLRARLATGGRKLFTTQFDLLHVGQRFARHLDELAHR